MLHPRLLCPMLLLLMLHQPSLPHLRLLPPRLLLWTLLQLKVLLPTPLHRRLPQASFKLVRPREIARTGKSSVIKLCRHLPAQTTTVIPLVLTVVLATLPRQSLATVLAEAAMATMTVAQVVLPIPVPQAQVPHRTQCMAWLVLPHAISMPGWRGICTRKVVVRLCLVVGHGRCDDSYTYAPRLLCLRLCLCRCFAAPLRESR